MSTAEAKLDALASELSKLTPEQRTEAITALKVAGLENLATALKAVVGGGSRPPERVETTYVPSN